MISAEPTDAMSAPTLAAMSATSLKRGTYARN